MSEPRKVRVLTRLRINEVSAVDRGAGENCKVVISKRDDDYSPEPLTNAERTRARIEGHTALRHQEEMEAREKRERDAEDRQHYFDLVTGRTSITDIYGVGKRNDGLIADEGVRYCLQCNAIKKGSHPHGAEAPAQSTTKSAEVKPMSLDLSEVVKAHGIGALCRHFIKSASSFGVDEHQLVKLATEDAHRRYPSDTEAMAFAKLYEESAELRDAIEIAKGASFQSDMSDAIERDAREACAELTKIGKARWPSLTPSQRFARAFETNPELAKRAHRRPGPTTSFAPVTKTFPLVNVDGVTLDPVTSTETDPNAADKALAQLRALGRQKWPSESAARQFLNAITDPENADLVTVATRTPKGSSPARQQNY